MNLNPLATPTFLLSLVWFWLGKAVPRKLDFKGLGLFVLLAGLLAVPGLLFVLYYTHLFDRATWFYYFRAFPYSELSASGMGLLAGILHFRLRPKTLGEKLVVPAVLVFLLLVPFVKSALDPVNYVQLQNTCEGEVCLQSTASTCGPSSAATILKFFGQTASEKELAHECFTYRGGTEVWFLARAFRQRGFTADFVLRSPEGSTPPSPSIAGVVLPGGAGHFIAVLTESAGQITIGDPLKGKLVLPKDEVRSAYRFTGFFLVIHKRS